MIFRRLSAKKRSYTAIKAGS